MNTYSSPYDRAVVDSRAAFIRKTYAHVAGALLVFAVLEAILLSIPAVRNAAISVVGRGKLIWLLVLGGFMLISWLANSWAHSSASRERQYFGLAVYVVAEALIFLPLIAIAMRFDQSGNLLVKAGFITTGLFMGLSSIVFITKKNFSFLRGIVVVGCWVALGTILASAIFGFSLGVVFISLMIALMAVSILYSTSQVMHDYPDWAYVGAALSLFASFATLLWYVIQLLLSLSSSND